MEKGMRLIDGVSVRDKFEDNLAYMGSEVKRILNIAPTVEAIPVVHGFWKKEIEDGMYWYVCSECGHEIPRDRYKHDWFSAYCPACGARMDMEEET